MQDTRINKEGKQLWTKYEYQENITIKTTIKKRTASNDNQVNKVNISWLQVISEYFFTAALDKELVFGAPQ